MKNVKRHFKKGYLYFLTHVTYNRNKILINNFDLLSNSFEKYKRENEFKLIAWIVLPDHMHFIIDSSTSNIPDLMKKIKLSFAMNYLKRVNQNGGRVWQNRYWDHQIRDENDLQTHMDYIHYNPVKHNYVTTPGEWVYSSFLSYFKKGIYSADWGTKEENRIDGRYGE